MGGLNWNDKYTYLENYVKVHNLKIKHVSMSFKYEVVGDVSRLSPRSLLFWFSYVLMCDDPFFPILLEIRDWDEKTQIIEYQVDCYIFIDPILGRYSPTPSRGSRRIVLPLSMDPTDFFFRDTTPGFTKMEKMEWKVGKVYAFEAMKKKSNLGEFWKWYSQVPKKGKETPDERMGYCFNYLNPGMFFYSGEFRKDDYLQAWFEDWVWEGERSPLMEVDLSERSAQTQGSHEFSQWSLLWGLDDLYSEICIDFLNDEFHKKQRPFTLEEQRAFELKQQRARDFDRIYNERFRHR